MLRRHFITGEETPDFIITYYASEHIPFCNGYKNEIYSLSLNDNSEIETKFKFKCILDTFNDGVGQYGIKLLSDNNGLWCSYWTTRFDTLNDFSSLGFYHEISSGITYNNTNDITCIILPKEIKHLNGTLMQDLNPHNYSVEIIILPDYLETFNNKVLYSLQAIKNIVIPDTVTFMGDYTLQIDCDSSFVGSSDTGNMSLEEIILKPFTPPDSDTNNPIGVYDISRYINPNLKIRVYADCIDKYKNDVIWGQYSDLYDTINNTIIYYANGKHNSNFENTIHNYNDDINRGVYLFNNEEVINLDNEFFYVDDIYITQECNIVINQLNSLHRLLKNVYIKTSKYDSRENCNCIIETSTNYLVLAGENMNIPDTVIGIYNYAIAIQNLTNIVTIPYNIKYINAFAFDKSTFRVLSINANDDLTIYNSLYNGRCEIYLLGCMIREHIIISESNYYYSSYYNYEYSNCGIVIKGNNTLIKAGCEDSIGPHVTNIQGAFAYNTELIRIIIPDNVLEIEGAFLDCTDLEYVTMSNNVTHIGDYTFSGCKKLHTDGIITDNVKSIGVEAFAGCNFVIFDTKNIESIDKISTNRLFVSTLIIRKSLKEFKGGVNINTNTLVVDDDSEYFKNENGCLIRKSDNALILVVAHTNTIIEGVEKLCSYSCQYANTELYIPNTIKVIEDKTFINNCFYIHYNGTLSEWEAIEKEDGWHNYRITIHCIDGDITID